MTSTDFTPDLREHRIAIIGAGGLGTTLAKRLVFCGYAVDTILNRSEDHAHRLADEVGASTTSSQLIDLPDHVRLIFVCVPDCEIEHVAGELYLVTHAWQKSVVAHTSGAFSSDVLALPAARGATVLSFFPIQTFQRGSAHDLFEGISIGLEGDDKAVLIGKQIAFDLGARPIVLSVEEKVRYHLAASIASNFLVALSGMSSEVLSSIGMNRKESSAFLRPLVNQTCRNLSEKLPEEALTGPIARGDDETVARHLSALKEYLPHLMPAYVSMASETIRVAVRGGRLSKTEARQLLDKLLEALEPY